MNAGNSPPPYLQERYRLVQWLGEGGMGVVYRAHDEVLDRPVAIKFLSPRSRARSAALARFLREARAVARLSHPHVMGVFDVGQAGAWHYLVLEFVPGRDLAAVLAEGALAVDTAVSHAVAILKALHYAHEQGIIHRDIKPENIIITPEGQVKVMDFGLALSLDEARLTEEGALIGTTLYLSPEQIQGREATVQTDLYAVGVVFYEMLTGEPPFGGDSLATILAQIINSPVPRPRLVNPAISPAVEQVVMKLLAKEANGRYPTAQAAIEALTGPTVQPKATLSSVMALTATADTLEAERRRLANLIERQVVEPLNLLLSQASAYEQSMASNPVAHMAVSVLGTLARQLLQQVRDLEANLHPTTLTSLGLEAALEGLANQVTRKSGVNIALDLARLPARLPAPLELALFRMAQEVVETIVTQARASHIAISLVYQPDWLVFQVVDDGQTALAQSSITVHQLIQLGGRITSAPGKITIQFSLKPEVELTPRELEVLQLVAYGLSNKEIAQRLSVSARTVNFHLDNVYSKLGVNSRTEAAVYALRQGWIRGTKG